MTEISDRYRRLSYAFAQRIDNVPADRWTSPSPCEEWTALDVVRHVTETPALFFGFVGRELESGPSVHEDPLGAFLAVREQVQAALEDPTRAREEFEGFFGRSTFADAIDRFIVFDLVVHGWDLARATGQDEHVEPEDVERTFDRARAFGDAIRGPGAFGPEVPAPADASEKQRLMAFLGRES